MPGRYNISKLIYIDEDQKHRLQEIKNEVLETGGDISLNQLIRDSIDLLVYSYKEEIVKHYTPRSIKSLINN